MERTCLFETGGVRLLLRGDLPAPTTEDYLPRFASDRGDPDAVITVRLVPEIPAPPAAAPVYENADCRVFDDGMTVCCFFRRVVGGQTVEFGRLSYLLQRPFARELLLTERFFPIAERHILPSFGFEELMLRLDRAALHTAWVSVPSGAILFTGPSGIGKSTQAALWRKHRGAVLRNGDRALLTFAEKRLTACGLPYCGTSGVCENITEPVAAIVLLGQSRENRLCRLRGSAAVKAVLSQIPVPARDASAVSRALDFAVRAAQSVPVFRLDCLPDESAVRLLAEALEER